MDMSNVGGGRGGDPPGSPSSPGPSGVYTADKTAGVPSFTEETKPISKPDSKTGMPSGPPGKKAEPTPVGEATVLRVTLKIPKDKFEDFTNSVSDYAWEIDIKVLGKGDQDDRLGFR